MALTIDDPEGKDKQLKLPEMQVPHRVTAPAIAAAIDLAWVASEEGA
jgi:hypothetical protein